MNYSLKDDPASYLQSTKLINSGHPHIIKKGIELTQDCSDPADRARAIFYFIRDDILYEFHAPLAEEAYRASSILKAGKGFCTQKAILFCALARSTGIPAGLYFYDIVDHTLRKETSAFLRTKTLFHHGITALYLQGYWRQYDATLDTPLAERKQILPVEFLPDRDCLMTYTESQSDPKIEYAVDYGLTSDVTFSEIHHWMKTGYPHLVERRSVRKSLD